MNKLLFTFISDSEPIFLESGNGFKTTRRLALITAVFALATICGFVNFSVEPFYYGCFAINLIYFASKGIKKLNAAFLLFYVVVILNLILIDIPPFFKPAQRFGLFVFMTLTTTSVIQSDAAVQFRRNLFKYITYGILILSIGSFFCFFLGINLMSRRDLSMSDFDAYSSNGGWFGGLTIHSMMLGPISMIASLLFFVLYLEKHRASYLVLFFITTMSAVFASSRSALLGIVISFLYSLFFGHIESKGKRRIFGLLIICTIFTLPISDIAFKGVINKQHNRLAQNSSLNSRQDKFDYRIAEFKSSPFLGVGFCAIDINGGDGYGEYDGRIEPGSSHLSVLSMTGLLGMMAYVAILYQAYANARKKSTPHSRFVLLCFISIFVHAWFEGYILSAGGFLAFLYWLIVGQCIDCKHFSHQKYIE